MTHEQRQEILEDIIEHLGALDEKQGAATSVLAFLVSAPDVFEDLLASEQLDEICARVLPGIHVELEEAKNKLELVLRLLAPLAFPN